MDPINLYEYEAIARAKLSPMAYDYYASGAHDEITLRDNHDAYDRIKLRYRVLRDVSRRTTETAVLGHPLRMPVLIAPTAFHKLAHPDGESATARAAGNAGTIMTLSTFSTTPIEDVMAAATGPVWFQLYVYQDRGAAQELMRRAEAAGCSAIVLTVDAQIRGQRERDVRNRFQLPPGISIQTLASAVADSPVPGEPETTGVNYATWPFDAALTWRDIEWLRGQTKLPLLLKGIIHPDDARLAVEHGAAGIIVSNHGGRQLDTAPATIDALPDIVEAVDNRVEVLVDGGIRRGTDVVKALALGAKAVAVGRPVLWGLAADGQSGVERVLEILRFEIDLAMGLCGCASVAEIERDLIV